MRMPSAHCDFQPEVSLDHRLRAQMSQCRMTRPAVQNTPIEVPTVNHSELPTEALLDP
jgi:hypothetical protein